MKLIETILWGIWAIEMWAIALYCLWDFWKENNK